MKTPRREVAPETLAALAQQLAAYRLDGCKTGAAAAVQAATKKVASKHGQSYSELWARVHAAAYTIIDRDPRAALGPKAG
jgi:hypothetical protein